MWNSGGSTYDLSTTTRYIYDNWNCIAEVNGGGTLLRDYAWGLDLSGSMYGAGGVGGLLMMDNVSNASSHYYRYDGNGNVVGLTDASTGASSADYEYGAFGEIVKISGTMKLMNDYQFSTKIADADSGFLYYGYRFYDPFKGRWLSRDLIEEAGGENLCAFIDNDPINHQDNLGLEKRFSGNPARLYLNWVFKGGNGGLSEEAIEIIKNDATYKFFKNSFIKHESKAYLICGEVGQFYLIYPDNQPGNFVPFSGYSGKFQFTFKASCSYSCEGKTPERCCNCRVKCDLNNNVSKLYTFDKGPNMNPINEGTFSKIFQNYRIDQNFSDTVEFNVSPK